MRGQGIIVLVPDDGVMSSALIGGIAHLLVVLARSGSASHVTMKDRPDRHAIYERGA